MPSNPCPYCDNGRCHYCNVVLHNHPPAQPIEKQEIPSIVRVIQTLAIQKEKKDGQV